MTLHRFDLDRIGAGLVVDTARAALVAAISRGAAVVTAPPGTGKTTLVPPLVANLVLDRAASGAAPPLPGRVLVTQPRRVAVRASANRLAALDGSDVGEAVGFTVRGERRVGDSTRVEAVTPGVLLRRMLSDPELTGIDAVILDEVHERSLDGDLLLAMLAEVRELRDDLLLVAMSATLDAGRFARLLGTPGDEAPVVEVPSALHPLDVAYAPFAGPRLDDRGVTRGYLEHLAQTTLAEQRAAGCDALVFVPGAREVDAVVELLRRGAGLIEVMPLHGRISPRDQDRAVRGRGPDQSPRIVVSTALAESSLTVPGVRLVIDSGLAREVRRDRARDMTGLVTVSASRASAEQRAGRAARLGPGRAVRAYAEADFARMPQASAPEIASADLTDAALLLAAWGTPGGTGLALPTAPPQAAMDDAQRVLHALELTGDTGSITALGRRISLLPIGVREARALIAGAARLGDAALAAEIVAAMTDDHRNRGADLGRLLTDLRRGSAPGADRWRREAKRLTTIARDSGSYSGDSDGAVEPEGAVPRETAPGIVSALARPEWLARRAGDGSRSYLLASGTRAALPEGSGLIGSDWIAVREVQRASGRAADGTGAVIRLAARIHEADALDIAGTLVTETREAAIVEGRLRVREVRRLGAIPLASTPAAARAEDSAAAFAVHLRDAGLGVLDWNEAAIALRARLALLHHVLGEPWPAVDDETLLARLDDWLGSDLERLSLSASVHRIDVAAALRRLLPWPEAARFDALAPERLAVPSGSTARIDYPADPSDASGRPTVSVKLQELFGLAETPRLVDGRVPVLFHLLSPARRPLAVTDDLSSFWNGPYQDVRKEMRGRYPKHPWPEDPWTAQATARTKNRMQ